MKTSSNVLIVVHLYTTTTTNPLLGRGLVIFIVIGTIFLVGFGFFYYFNHMHDPKYTLTSIEPDSNLAERML